MNLRRRIVGFLKILNSFRPAVCPAASDRTTVSVVTLLDYFMSSLSSCKFAYDDVTNANKSGKVRIRGCFVVNDYYYLLSLFFYWQSSLSGPNEMVLIQ